MSIRICPECGGEGSHEVPYPQRDDPYFCMVEQCRNCGGVGRVQEDGPPEHEGQIPGACNMMIDLDIPHTAAERQAREAESIWGLIKRIEARASDGRFYQLEDEDREKAIGYLKGYAKTRGPCGENAP